MAGKLTCVNIETTQASAVTAPSIVGPDDDWIGLPGSYSGNVFYRKLPTGVVALMVVPGFSAPDGATLGTLPAGYFPGNPSSVVCQTNLTFGTVELYKLTVSEVNGAVTIGRIGSATGNVDLMGMQTVFMAEA